jgi:hypothetical protein
VWSVARGGIATLLVVMLVMWIWPQVVKIGPLHAQASTDKEKEMLELSQKTGGDGLLP